MQAVNIIFLLDLNAEVKLSVTESLSELICIMNVYTLYFICCQVFCMYAVQLQCSRCREYSLQPQRLAVAVLVIFCLLCKIVSTHI